LELCLKLAWRHKGLSERSLDIAKKTLTILLLLVAPQPVQNASITEAKFEAYRPLLETSKTTSSQVGVDWGTTSSPSAATNAQIARAAALRCIEAEKKFSISKWTCLLLRNLMSTQKSQHLPELKCLLHVKDIIRGACGEKFAFQSQRYQERIESDKKGMMKKKLEDREYDDDDDDDDDNNGGSNGYGHLLPNEPVAGGRKMRPEEEEMLKVAETELIQAKVRFCDVLSLGASFLQLQCSSSGAFFEHHRTEIAARGYDKMPDWNLNNLEVLTFIHSFIVFYTAYRS
jgi:hypothetical protein